MKRYAAGSLQGAPEAVNLLGSGSGLQSLVAGLGIVDYLGPVFGPIDSHNCIKFLAGEFELKNSFRDSC